MSVVPAFRVAVIGGGPAGLMAAERLAAGGTQVDLFDAMPSVGRKFLLAGKGGLNLTHSESLPAFVARYGARRESIAPMLARFGPTELRRWAEGLGVATFIGSSGRVFPSRLKAAPLLRAWLARLRAAGVIFHMRQRWRGWADAEGGHTLRFSGAAGEQLHRCDAVVLALGGASWPQLGSDGAWLPLLQARGVEVAPLQASNCGFDIARPGADQLQPGWSAFFRERFAGHALKNVALSVAAPTADPEGAGGFDQPGEFIVTQGGIEGSLVYAASAIARDAIAAAGRATVVLDLLPGRSAEFVHAEVARPRGTRSLATHLKSRLGIDGVKSALLHELLTRAQIADPVALAAAIKALPLTLVAARPIAEAISTAGGVRFEALDAGLAVYGMPGLHCAGEMLDWEAPTGGYLLTACMASGIVAAEGVLARRAAVLQRDGPAASSDPAAGA